MPDISVWKQTVAEEGLFIVLIQVYNWEIRHHSTVCRCGLVDYEQSLFLLSPSSKTTATRKKWPRAWLKARDGRGEQSLFFLFLSFSSRAAALVSRVSRLRRSTLACARALPLLNLKKNRDCSQSSGLVACENIRFSSRLRRLVDLLIFYILNTIMFVCCWQEICFIW